MKSAGKRSSVASYLFVEPLDCDAIEFRKISIQDDFLVAEDQDPRFDG